MAGLSPDIRTGIRMGPRSTVSRNIGRKPSAELIPADAAGDVIGCGVDFTKHKVFYTKNGNFLGECASIGLTNPFNYLS